MRPDMEYIAFSGTSASVFLMCMEALNALGARFFNVQTSSSYMEKMCLYGASDLLKIYTTLFSSPSSRLISILNFQHINNTKPKASHHITSETSKQDKTKRENKELWCLWYLRIGIAAPLCFCPGIAASSEKHKELMRGQGTKRHK